MSVYSAKNAADLVYLVETELAAGRVPVVVADQPAIVNIALSSVLKGVTSNDKYDQGSVVRFIQSLVNMRKHGSDAATDFVVIVKHSKIAIGSFYDPFTKIIATNINVTVASVANYLAGQE